MKKQYECAFCGETVERDIRKSRRHLKVYCSAECFHKSKFGRAFSEDHRKNLSKALKGHLVPEETREKIKKSLNGHEVSKETREKLSAAHSGKRLSSKTKEKISRSLLGNERSLGYKHTKEARESMSKKRSGSKHPNWQGGRSREPYGEEFGARLKRTIRERDDYTCRLCGLSQETPAPHVHHIDYDKSNNGLDNLVCLCHRCHSKTNWNRDGWQKYFTEVMLTIDATV